MIKSTFHLLLIAALIKLVSIPAYAVAICDSALSRVLTLSTTVAIPIVSNCGVVTLLNDSNSMIFVKLGDVTVTVDKRGIPVLPGKSISLAIGGNAYVAAISGSVQGVLRVFVAASAIEFNKQPNLNGILVAPGLFLWFGPSETALEY